MWEVEENIQKSKASLEFVMSGCKCKKGCCDRKCSCQRKEKLCGPGCKCRNCQNTTTTTTTQGISLDLVEIQDLLEEEQTSETEYVDSSDDDLEEFREEMMGDEELDEIMHNVFGDDSDEDDIM